MTEQEPKSECCELPPHTCGRCGNWTPRGPFVGHCIICDKIMHRRMYCPVECEDYEDCKVKEESGG